MNFALPFGNRLRTTPAGVKLTLAMCLGFAALLFAGVHAGREFSIFWRPASSSAPAQAPAAPSGVIDPVAQFPQTRVGHLLFTSSDDDTCRRVLFDNRTGATVEVGRIVCNSTPTRTADITGEDRMRSLRKSFRR